MSPLQQFFDGTAEAAMALGKWVRSNGWAGYDPYDLPGYLFDCRTMGTPVSKEAEAILRRRDQDDPLGVRCELGIAPKVNAKSMGLFLGAYCLLQDVLPGQDYSVEVLACDEWLAQNSVSGFAGTGWGYPFNWESYVVIPAGVPTAVNSCHVGDGYRAMFKSTGSVLWLERCLRISDFLLNDLNVDRVPGRGCCFSYTPIDFFHVNNANLGTAEFLLWTGLEGGREEFVNAGLDALAFSLSDFDDRGALAYWAEGFEPKPDLAGFMDHYHTAAELRSLLRICRMFPERNDVNEAFQSYFQFYLDAFFDVESRPVLRPGFDWLPFDIHAGAEAAYLLGEMLPDHPAAKEKLMVFLPWFLDSCRNADGSFIHRIEMRDGEQLVRPFPFLRWGQAWVLRGLASVLQGIRATGEAS
ncbi:MAG: hypothetical protein JEY79_05715 [Pseudodesulfovibrio sp.]|nr:hypothetical protein [Pseudodesulfovibrio sp.]